jgi:hypothetical protein
MKALKPLRGKLQRFFRLPMREKRRLSVFSCQYLGLTSLQKTTVLTVSTMTAPGTAGAESL